MDASSFTLSSGRVVGVTEFGDPDSEHVVVFAHPAPGSSFFDPDPAATAARGVRVIALDRPGYGPSELLDGGPASVGRAADDVAEYLARRGIRKVGAAGWSAGGRIALALAARHPELVDRVAVIGTPADDNDVPWVGEQNLEMLVPLREVSLGEATRRLSDLFQRFGDPDPSTLVHDVVTEEVDDALLEVVDDRLTAMMVRALQQGRLGMAADILSYTIMDLELDFDAVAAKVLLVYGLDDSIGEPHARWYDEHLSDSMLELVPDVGHLVVVPSWDRVLDHIAPGTKGE